MSEQHLGYIEVCKACRMYQHLMLLGWYIACGYSSGQTCQKKKKPPCRSVAAQIAHFVQRESFHALDIVVMHCDNSATFAFLNHNIQFSHKIFPDDKACLEEYYVLSIMYLFTLLPAPLHYILLFCDYNIGYFNVGANFCGQTLGYD